MTGSLDALFAATVLFVGGHFALSSLPVRLALINKLGETRFLVAYSIVILVVFAWMAAAFADAPVEALWTPAPALGWLPAIAMPISIFLMVCGITTPSPTLAGARLDDPGRNLVGGIVRITRHPFLNGTALWAIVHLAANGESRSVILFAGILILSVGGMWHIDKRREFLYGADWGPVLMSTSVVPFAAILAGRTTFDWAGIGWWRVLAAVAIYLALVGIHPFALGVPAWPGLG
jgi:uncharacterized membrane protein